MAVTKIVFADISTFKVDATTIEGIQGAQINEPAEIRPIYTWNKALPVVLISVPVLGSGSFSYIASDGAGSTLDENWKTLLDGTSSVVITGGLTTGNSSISSGTVTLTLTKCTYQGKSFGMNARNEAVVNINFAYEQGLNG
jgi:hypothetical protein